MTTTRTCSPSTVRSVSPSGYRRSHPGISIGSPSAVPSGTNTPTCTPAADGMSESAGGTGRPASWIRSTCPSAIAVSSPVAALSRLRVSTNCIEIPSATKITISTSAWESAMRSRRERNI